MKVLFMSALLQKRYVFPKITSLFDKAPSDDRLRDRTKKIPFWLRQEISKSILFWKQKTCEFCELFIETFLSFCESYRLTFHTWGFKVTKIYSTFFMIFYEFSGFCLIVTFNLLRFNFNDDYFYSVKNIYFVLICLVMKA